MRLVYGHVDTTVLNHEVVRYPILSNVNHEVVRIPILPNINTMRYDLWQYHYHYI